MFSFKNKKVLVTAGPTREYLDPVRFLSNESSGKMGYAIAEILHELGAIVFLVSGPVSIRTAFPLHKIIHVVTGHEMFVQSAALFEEIDIAVFCAAVADYTPKVTTTEKIKKSETELSIVFQKNKDIAFEFGKIKTDHQLSVGFALETHDVLAHATAKLLKKNFDCIVANSPNPGEGFGADTNKVFILNRELERRDFELKSKKEVAQDIVNAIGECSISGRYQNMLLAK